MQLPNVLKQAIENEIAFKSLQTLSEASSDLTSRYRKGASSLRYVRTETDRLAYILSRMPATYAVVCKVLDELIRRMPSLDIKSFLDLGSGPGTALWAVSEIFPELDHFTSWEYDEGFIDLSIRLSKSHERLSKGLYLRKNFEVDRDFKEVDLALLSYSIGEVSEKYWESFFTSLWQKVGKALVIIEPGTPIGYQRIISIRDLMLSLGATLIAPCPHSLNCPMKGQDWCHFFARVERSSLHRRIKQGELNFEDEKFSYLIFAKSPVEEKIQSRILRHPKIHKGFFNLTTCEETGNIKEITITKKDKDIYKSIKKKEWGDGI